MQYFNNMEQDLAENIKLVVAKEFDGTGVECIIA